MLSRLLLLQQLSPAASSAAAGAAVGGRGLLQLLSRSISSTAAAEQEQDQGSSSQPPADQPAGQLQQQQLQARPRLLRQQPRAAAAAVTSPHAAQPVLPGPIILKVLLCAERPLTSHELWAEVHRDYGYRIPTRSQFKAQLKGLFRARLVRAVSPAAAGATGAKGRASEPFVYVVTDAGRAVDLNEGGSRLHAKARALADEWTTQQLPQYKQHLAAGRVPLTPDNEGLLSPEEKQRLVEQWQVKHAKHQQARAQAAAGAWQQQLQALEAKQARKPQQTKQQQHKQQKQQQKQQ